MYYMYIQICSHVNDDKRVGLDSDLLELGATESGLGYMSITRLHTHMLKP